MTQQSKKPKIKKPEDITRLRSFLLEDSSVSDDRVVVCCGTGCLASGSKAVKETFDKEIEKLGRGQAIEVKKSGCRGFCECGPIAVVGKEQVFYTGVRAKDVPEIVTETLEEGKIIDRLLWKDPATKKKHAHELDIPFYKKQKRVVLKNCGHIDPTNIEDYIKSDGYSALAKVLSKMSPKEVITCIKESGLRGRGGAGFPTGRKWESSRKAPGKEKYIVCNGDEGDPGAFMDRSIMEGDPQSVLEGMIIGGYAVGAQKGFIYVRSEYPLAVRHLAKAIAQARDLGGLGSNIFGSGFSFDIEIVKGAGAFVCGESTALVMSIEGQRGFPKSVPRPNTSIEGLWGMPTVLNNVETLACVPPIIQNGQQWFKDLGSEGNAGTKIFALTGKVKNTGLAEVHMGTTLREIIFDIGGGIRRNRAFKAIQTGGPSGGCIPEALADLPVEYESLAEAGSIMGSGGIVVMDETTCMADVARYFLNFTKTESCGQCPPCREGLGRLYDILDRICKGQGKEQDIEKLESLSLAIKDSSLCGLGQSAPNPILTVLQYFREELEAHIVDKKCPAGVCPDLVDYSIDSEKCSACGLCRKACPVEAIEGARKVAHKINPDLCVRCGSCFEACPPKISAVIRK